MAYFLKKSKLKGGTYIQIYESFYNPDKKGTSHKSYKSIGYVEKLIADGMEDPIAYYSNVVKEMNEAAKLAKEEEKSRQISSPPERYLGFFLLKSVYDSLNVSNYLDLMQSIREFRFNISKLIEALVYSRVVEPCSKRKSLNDVFPRLYGEYSFSYDQLLDGIEYIGQEYEKIIEIFNHQINRKYPINTATTYFDCTNFYFEIDREDSLRRKGPSKENRHDPVVGMGLLLDANQIPIGMKLYPGNESEHPVIRKVIDELKQRNDIAGRTIQVADKGLNSAENIVHALKNGDGYIFSKSVKKLPEIEKTWVLLENGYRDVLGDDKKLLYKIKECDDEFPYTYTNEHGKKVTVRLKEKRIATYNPKLAAKKKYEITKLIEKAKSLKASQAKRSEYGECGKYVTFTSIDKKGEITNKKIKVTINEAAIEKDFALAGYNLIVTSEVEMSPRLIHETYHNLWRIEESFKVMKSYLDARPVYLQKSNSIKGHFLICYLSILLLRLLQFKILKNEYCTEKLIDFIRSFRVVEIEHNKYINLSPASDFIEDLARSLKLPLTNYFLTVSEIKKVLAHKF
ncbi:MAG: IS1634 family transposase [Lachnospiraceae bacterium]|nr:IS1634 family transposase [Lachnospiraceae bacterium]